MLFSKLYTDDSLIFEIKQWACHQFMVHVDTFVSLFLPSAWNISALIQNNVFGAVNKMKNTNKQAKK